MDTTFIRVSLAGVSPLCEWVTFPGYGLDGTGAFDGSRGFDFSAADGT
jgi:hypothetical protein